MVHMEKKINKVGGDRETEKKTSKKKERVRIIFHPLNKVVEVEKGTTLLEAIRQAGIQIEAICGGKGLCGKCRAILRKGEVEYVSDAYKKHLSRQEIKEGYILSCQTRVLTDSEFTIPVESRIYRPKILLSAELKIKRFHPAVGKYLVKVSLNEFFMRPSLRLEGYSGPRPRVSDEMYKKIVSMDKPATATVSWTNKYPEIISVEPGDQTKFNYGLAIDLGTTTVVGVLVDLTNGEILARGSTLNKQITYGEELLTRIAYAGKHREGLKQLQSAAVESINEVVNGLASSANVEKGCITDVCVGGNTVMNHLLVGKDPAYLEMANIEVSRDPFVVKAKKLGMDVNPEAYVYCLPNVSRFLGGDAVGDVIASGMHTSKELSLLIDLGTNGEIIFGNEDWLASASCASGPAFEGAGIKFGMRAMMGAIEHVKVNPKTYEASYTVIGNTPPRGICGSGIIDAAAEMFSAGILDFAGKLVKGKTPLVREGPDGLEYVLVPAEKTAIGRDIVITQRDIDYLMDSKAAACGAIGVLMKKYKLSIYDVKHVYLAGAFGAFTNLENVIKFGIIPEFKNAEFHPIGNGSLSGAYATLVSMKKREEARTIAEKMVYIDLLVDVDFIEEYSAAIYIPGKREFYPTYYSKHKTFSHSAA